MPPLARVPGLRDALGQEALDALARAQIRGTKEILAVDPHDIERHTGLLPSNIAAAVRLILSAEDTDPDGSATSAARDPLPTAFDILRRKWRFRPEWWLSTGCDGIDGLLEGGLKAGEVTEIAGAPASGKTQLCLFAVVVALASDPTATAVYIDSGAAFSPERVAELFTESDRFVQVREGGMEASDLLSRITVHRVFDVPALLETVRCVHAEQGVKLKSGQKSRLRIVVVDSVSAPFSAILTIKLWRSFYLLTTMSRMLNSLARTHNIVVLVTNGTVGARPSNPLSSFVGSSVKPALGTTWTSAPAVQLFLSVVRATKPSRSGHRGDDNLAAAFAGQIENSRQVFPFARRLCEVLRSRRTAAYRWTYFYIGKEIISPLDVL